MALRLARITVCFDAGLFLIYKMIEKSLKDSTLLNS